MSRSENDIHPRNTAGAWGSGRSVRSRISVWLAAAACLGAPASGRAAETVAADPSLEVMSLQDLLNMDIGTLATKSTATSTEEAPAIVTILYREDLLRRGYRHLGEALASVPGMYVIDDLTTSNVGIRGLNSGFDSWSRNVKFMIDGNPVQYIPTGGAFVGPEYIPIEAVEAIEIIRGPGSALYGANAFLGVVNVVTRDYPGEGPGIHGTAAVSGSLIRDNLGAGVGGMVSARLMSERPLDLMVAFSAQRADRSGLSAPESSPLLEDYADQASESDISQPRSGIAKLSWDGDDIGNIELDGFYQRLDADARFSVISALESDNRYVKSNAGGFVRYELDLLSRNPGKDNELALGEAFGGEGTPSQTARLSVWGGYTRGTTGEDEVFDLGEEDALYHRERRGVGIHGGGDLSYSFGRSSALAGVDYLRVNDEGDLIVDIDRASREGVERNEPVPFSYSNVAPYGQIIIYPIKRIGLTGGLRYDVNDRWGSQLSTRAAAVVNIVENVHAKLLYGTSYVPPSPDQLGAVALAVDGGTTGNPNLTPQTARTIEAQLRYDLDQTFDVALTGFTTQVEDRVEFVNQGYRRVASNISRSNSIGAELSSRVSYQWLFADGDLSVQRTRVEDPEVSNFQWSQVYNDDEFGRAAPGFPGMMTHLRVGTTWPEYHFEVGVQGAWVGARKTTFENAVLNQGAYQLDPYATLDLNARSLDLTFFGDHVTEFDLRVTNLLNARYSEGGAVGVDIPAIGRSAYLTVTQSF